jgi:hypothetical protein
MRLTERLPMSDPHQTPLQEAISFLTIAAILVSVGCYVAALQNIPVASPTLFWVASMLPLPPVPRFERRQGATNAHASKRCSIWRRFLYYGNPVRGVVSYVVFNRAIGKLGAPDGGAPAQAN